MNPKARQKNIIVQNAGEETLVYDLDANKATSLNSTSGLIWKSCDGNNSIEDIADIVETKTGEKVNVDLILFALDQLKKENLLEDSEDIRTGFDGLSRREVIKKVGFTSMVALPIVASLTAPMAVSAQSCAAVAGSMGTLAGLQCMIMDGGASKDAECINLFGPGAEFSGNCDDNGGAGPTTFDCGCA